MVRQRLFFRLLSFWLTAIALAACGNHTEPNLAESALNSRTPVTVTTVSRQTIIAYVTLNATSQFMRKNYVKASINGYVQSVQTALGKEVTTGQTLFVLKTKEATSIGNAINKLDPSFQFSGVSYIKASGRGFISVMNHQPGDYVQDGEQLAVINDASSFAFLLNLPYDMRSALLEQKKVTLYLPDSTAFTGIVTTVFPSVDPASQTLQAVIKVDGSPSIPENLIAQVRLIKTQKTNTQSLPKGAILSNEAQTEFWVMKVVNDSTAIKQNVVRGLETPESIEVLSPTLSPTDRILISGNYGLADTAGIIITENKGVHP